MTNLHLGNHRGDVAAFLQELPTKSREAAWESCRRVAAVSGRFRHETQAPADFPVVGDWVLQRDGVIHALLPRRTAFSRKTNLGLIEEQVAAANVDVVFVVAALDSEPNLRRIERYVTVAYESGAEPVLLLSKADLCDDVDAAVAAVRDVVPGTPVRAVSARTGGGLEVLDTYCRPGRTAVFLGPSGVGKTTLLNALTGTERATTAVREDGRGRHTTTQRELVLVEGRGLVIDTPGMRELQRCSRTWKRSPANAGSRTARTPASPAARSGLHWIPVGSTESASPATASWSARSCSSRRSAT